MWGRRLRLWLVSLIMGLALAGPVLAQQNGLQMGQPVAPPVGAILTISSDRMFTDSLFGQRVAREIAAQTAVLAAENRRIESELVLEEQDLTQKRADMSPENFRVLADGFDDKVQNIRREQEAKARAVTEAQDLGQIQFLEAARPILVQIMQETGAGVILERATVLMSSNATDITDLAIQRIDQTLGDGSED